jgi:hypothetical protein
LDGPYFNSKYVPAEFRPRFDEAESAKHRSGRFTAGY